MIRNTKPELKADLNTRSSYKLYRSLTDNPQDVKIYLDIANGYVDFLLAKVHEGEEVTLPAKMGTLAIIGSKRKLRFTEDGKPLLPPNWRKTKALQSRDEQAREQKKIVYCTNEHTSGVVYKFLWSKMRMIIENKTLYCLRLTRQHKRKVNVAVTSGKEYTIKNR